VTTPRSLDFPAGLSDDETLARLETFLTDHAVDCQRAHESEWIANDVDPDLIDQYVAVDRLAFAENIEAVLAHVRASLEARRFADGVLGVIGDAGCGRVSSRALARVETPTSSWRPSRTC
jgi:hypothetical protein